MQKIRGWILGKVAACMLMFAMIGQVFAEITVQINTAPTANVRFTNNTGQAWRLGGVRYTTNGGQWTAIDNWLFSQGQIRILPGADNEVDIYYTSTAPSDNAALLRAGSSTGLAHVWSHPNHASLAQREGTEVQLLLKTGAPGIPDDPISHPSITCGELADIVSDPNFHNRAFRHASYDSLGSNGGRYSGGFINTYVGRTQIHFAIPRGNQIRGAAAMRGLGAPAYYMALAMGQELLNVDAQWMFAMGAKESWSGTQVNYGDTWNGQNIWWATGDMAVNSGNYTSWHVESFSGGDRALNFPHLFPRFSHILSQARDLTTYIQLLRRPENAHLIPQGSTAETALMDYYVGGYDARYHPRSINGLFVSAMFQYVNYDILARASDICWKYGLANSCDRYMGLSLMLAMYNLGQWGLMGTAVGQLGNSNIQALVADCNARERFPTGNMDYRNDILGVVQALVNASRDFTIGDGQNSEIIDFEISLERLLEMFFGRGGTVAHQGEGGILLHYYPTNIQGTNHTAVRQTIFDNLNCAFNFLKGKAPNAAGTGRVGAEMISFRYDFLSVIRTVKAFLPLDRRFVANGDASTLIPNNSRVGCNVESGGTIDEIYPRIPNIDIRADEFVCTLIVYMTDNVMNGNVRWTLDRTWSVFNAAEMIEAVAGTSNTFRIVVPKEMAETFGHTIWVFAEDASGNTVVARRTLRFAMEFQPPALNNAAVFDTTGNGYINRIRANIVSDQFGSLARPYPSTVYRWRWNNSQLINIQNVAVNGSTLTIDVAEFESGAGSGELLVIFDILDVEGDNSPTGDRDTIRVPLIDSVGPALLRFEQDPQGDANFSASNGGAGQFDTLWVKFSENVRNITAATALEFKPTRSVSATGVIEGGGRHGFLFTPGTLVEMTNGEDSVRINIASGITDASSQNNPVLAITQFVRVHFKKEFVPPVPVSAAFFNKFGDGFADSLRVVIERNSVGDLSGSTNIYTWRLGNNPRGPLPASARIASDRDTLFINWDPNLISGDATGWLYMEYDSINHETGATVRATTQPIAILDRVGPAIRIGSPAFSANVREDSSLPDTLRLEFTEEIRGVQNGRVQLLFAKDQFGTGAFGIRNIAEPSRAGNVYTFLLEPGIIRPDLDVEELYYEWVKIDFEGGITDNASPDNNLPLENNQWRRIEDETTAVNWIPFEIRYVEFFSYTIPPADGYVDTIRVRFNFDPTEYEGFGNALPDIRRLVAESFNRSLHLDNQTGRRFNSISELNVRIIETDFLSIGVSQDQSAVSARTDIDERDQISLNHTVRSQDFDAIGISVNQSFQPIDRIAPIIERAQFNFMAIKCDDDEPTELIDNLVITFSEEVRGTITPDMIRMKGADGVYYNIAFDPETNVSGRTITFLVRNISRLPEVGDEIRIERGVSDNRGNTQEVNTVWVPIGIGTADVDFDILAFPNPYSPNAMRRNENYIRYLLDNYGISTGRGDMAFVIKPCGGGRKLVGDFSGRITILDGLGNTVVETESFYFNQSKGLLTWTWDGKNPRRRNVGAGAYMAIIAVTFEQNGFPRTQEFRRTIGITRE
ncbi:MAG: hypothetical protein FWE23_09745 [Chitinivibrionia bacterium]|nr:hypothetical protein [Chitinivibrionia bacterium]